MNNLTSDINGRRSKFIFLDFIGFTMNLKSRTLSELNIRYNSSRICPMHSVLPFLQVSTRLLYPFPCSSVQHLHRNALESSAYLLTATFTLITARHDLWLSTNAYNIGLVVCKASTALHWRSFSSSSQQSHRQHTALKNHQNHEAALLFQMLSISALRIYQVSCVKENRYIQLAAAPRWIPGQLQ